MQLPPNVSPVSASFFGIQRQGIHLVLCVACSLLFGSLRDPLLLLLLISLSKIEDSSYSVVHVPLLVAVFVPLTTQEWKPVVYLFCLTCL